MKGRRSFSLKPSSHVYLRANEELRSSHKKGARGLEPGALACGLRRGKGGRVKPLRTPRMLV